MVLKKWSEIVCSAGLAYWVCALQALNYKTIAGNVIRVGTYVFFPS